MSTLLRIDASSRTKDSQSRELADLFVNHWLETHPGGEVRVRDLVLDPVPHISNDTIAGFYTPRAEHDDNLRLATARSDALIREIMEADAVLIDTPMYNFSMPSALKAWIDQVARIGETFSFSPESGFEGLIKNTAFYVITASGAVFSSDAMQPMDFLTPYLRALLGFLGITQLQFFTLEGTTVDPDAYERSKQAAVRQIETLWVTA